MKIAIYGKGGIGKSTISSNISVCMAKNGRKVLQIGCDPKHDSTLLLLNDNLNPILNVITEKLNYSMADLFATGKYGVDCIEIGGPAPGVGCAGRGIIKGLEVINEFNLLENNYDLITYDVLGDVVCGGFFEPVKKGGVQEIYIITSGEFNSLFAANNICKGYLNCKLQDKKIKLSGIIGNYRNIPNESNVVRDFCQKTNLRLIAEISRDNDIERNTSKGLPFVEQCPESESAKQINIICNYIQDKNKRMQIPTPLELHELREIVLKYAN